MIYRSGFDNQKNSFRFFCNSFLKKKKTFELFENVSNIHLEITIPLSTVLFGQASQGKFFFNQKLK